MQGGHFHPACFQMQFKINWSSVADGFSFTVTLPFLVGCLNCLWLPLWSARYQPSASSILITSETLYLFISPIV